MTTSAANRLVAAYAASGAASSPGTASQAHGKERLRSDLNPNLTNQPEGKVKAHDWADREEQGAGGAREMSDNKIIFGPGRRQLLEQQRQYAKDEELRSAFQQGFGAGVKSAQLAARTEGASARAVEGEQLAWLIEWPADDNLPTRYWNPDTGWMLDPHKACWFVRKQDAEAYRKQSLLSYSRIVEHKFGLSLPHPEEAPEGWVLVPREPTEAMLVSGRIAASTDDAQPITGEIKAAWHAMLSAAPTVGGRG